MRVMLFTKVIADGEVRVVGPTDLLEVTGAFNEELVKAVNMQVVEEFTRSAHERRLVFGGEDRTLTDRPVAAARELVACFWFGEVSDLAEAVGGVERCCSPMPGPSEIEIRPLFEVVDFGGEITPKVAELEARVRGPLGIL